MDFEVALDTFRERLHLRAEPKGRMAGMMTIRAGQVSQSRTIADNLAREGIEIVRNIRDTNWLIDIDKINVENGDPLRCGIDTGPVRWDTCFCNTNDDTVTLELTPGTGWALNPDPDDIDSDAALVYLVSAVDPDDPPSYYTQAPAGNAEPTIYHRLITLKPSATSISDCASNDPDAIPENYTIKSEVNWTEKGKTHSAKLIEQIYNWRP